MTEVSRRHRVPRRHDVHQCRYTCQCVFSKAMSLNMLLYTREEVGTSSEAVGAVEEKWDGLVCDWSATDRNVVRTFVFKPCARGSDRVRGAIIDLVCLMFVNLDRTPENEKPPSKRDKRRALTQRWNSENGEGGILSTPASLRRLDDVLKC